MWALDANWICAEKGINMRINGAIIALSRALMRKAISTRSAKVIAAKTNISSSKKDNNTTSTSSVTDKNSNYTAEQNKKLSAYEKIETSAAALKKNITALMQIQKSDEDSEKENTTSENLSTAESDKLKDELIDYITSFVNDYNMLYDSLKQAGGSANIAQVNALKNIVTAQSKSLSTVGITINSGVMSLDTDALKQKDIEALKEAFCADNSITSNLNERIASIESNAKNTLSTLEKTYTLQNYTKYGTTNCYYNYAGSSYSKSV